MMVKSGIDVLHADNYAALTGKRIGLLTNPSAVDEQMVSTYRRLHEAANVDLVALYGAEHGAFGRVQAGEEVGAATDPRTGIPVHSLYGASYRPTPEMLDGIELMVCDIQDIGVRYYTYLWTMTYVLEACGEAGIPVMVLDRPNPLGDTVAGRGLDMRFSSLVGRYDLPIQHGMTVGEALKLHNAEWNPTSAELTVIACQDYQRAMTWDAVTRPFVTTSPNIPTITTVRHYPGACLIEGTTLSEGRGTTLPFEITGAPYIDGRDLADALNDLSLPDVAFRPHQFTPLMSKYEGQACEGVQVHIMGDRFDALNVWLHVIHTVKSLYPDDFGWRDPWAVGDHPPFDKLIGGDEPRQMFEDGASVAEIIADWPQQVTAFRQQRQPYLIYG